MKQKIKLNLDIYPLEVSMKAAYNYIEKVYIFFEKDSEKIYEIEFESKDEKVDLNKVISEFKNELLHEKIRKNISDETRNIREILLARALYGFALENNEVDKNNIDLNIKNNDNEESYINDKENIGKSWFNECM